MIRFYHMPTESGGGDSPENYKPLTPIQRRDWNKFLDWAQQEGIAGSKDMDATDKNTGSDALKKYIKENPDTTIAENHLPYIQYEHQQLRSGTSFPGLTGPQLSFVQQSMSDGYKNRPTAKVGDTLNTAMSRQYYPTFQMGDNSYGTDMGRVFSDSTGKVKPETADLKNSRIPLPDYSDTTSRQNYLKNWAKKYGDLEGRGDTVLKVNETPRGGSSSMKNISINAAKQYGIDPALLYSSAMEEGASGLFKDKSGLDTKHRKPGQPGYEDYFGDKEYPISGSNSFGFQTFADRFPDLVKKGLLPKEFESKFRKKDATIAEGKVESANDFKTVEDAMQAKAAMMKYGEDYVDEYAKEHNIKLSDKEKEYFTLAWFNGGEGAVHKMVKYDKEGELADDKILKSRPKDDESVKGTSNDVYGHTIRRILMAQNLKFEGLF